MSLLRILTLVLLFAGAVNSWAGDNKEFHLKDGSTLTGQLVSVTEGRFVVQSPSLGRVELDADEVVSMNAPGAPAGAQAAGVPAGGNVDFQQLITQTQNRIYSDPALMKKVQDLSNDPQLTALVNDPSFVQLLMSGDLQAIQSDPRMQKLMNHPQLQGLVGQLSGAQ